MSTPEFIVAAQSEPGSPEGFYIAFGDKVFRLPTQFMTRDDFELNHRVLQRGFAIPSEETDVRKIAENEVRRLVPKSKLSTRRSMGQGIMKPRPTEQKAAETDADTEHEDDAA